MEPRYQPSFSLCFGYLPEIDYMSDAAAGLGLRQRMSLVLETYHPETGSIFFDAAMFTLLMNAILGCYPANSVAVQYQTGNTVTYTPAVLPEHAVAAITGDGLPGEDQSPPERLHAYSGTQPILYAELENYAAVGGPSPYHDSFTYAVYSTALQRDILEARITAVAAAAGLLLKAVHAGGEKPSVSLATRIKKLF